MDKQIKCKIEYIIWQNEENGYAICALSNETIGDFVGVGYIGFLNPGDKIFAMGQWETHLEYGEQFKIETYEKEKLELEEDILLYLSSGAIKGIGESTAKKIVDLFGGNALDIIRNEPLSLVKIKGISEKKAISIQQDYIKQLGVQDTIIFFNKYGVGSSFAYKVYKEYGDKAIEKISENPYILCWDIDGIGFKTADAMAEKLGVKKNSPLRIEAAILHILSEAVGEGHTYLKKSELLSKTCALLNSEIKETESALFTMTAQSDVRILTENDDVFVYLPAYYIAEHGVASYLSHFAMSKFKVKKNIFEEDIEQVENELGTTLAQKQKEAVRSAVDNGLLIITGGPGTGKTTIIRAIIALMRRMNLKVALAAPTGRAAKRMTQVCNKDAKTIHRMLEMDVSKGANKWVFGRNDANPLSADVIIIDEMSMVDILLMYHLLKAVKKGSRLIMVGDSDQLPSVGAGRVLKDMIESETVKTIRLTEIFRQAEESMIVVNAHKINNGNMPEVSGKNSDFFMIGRPSSQDGVKEITQLYINRLPKFLKTDDFLSNIQILTPIKKGETGVEELNKKLQNLINPPSKNKKEVTRGFYTIREGDKVMQTKNNYEIDWEREDGSKGGGLYNGDIGFVIEVHNKEGYAKIVFDNEKIVNYPFELLKDIELAYAMTVHKSQGSEFDAVIMPVYRTHSHLMSRNLLYTAVTRARKLVVLVGRSDVVAEMINNDNEDKRNSNLKNIITTAFNNTQFLME